MCERYGVTCERSGVNLCVRPREVTTATQNWETRRRPASAVPSRTRVSGRAARVCRARRPARGERGAWRGERYQRYTFLCVFTCVLLRKAVFVSPRSPTRLSTSLRIGVGILRAP
eukprot:scaffold74945_cov63-Phaeocystis_antarctica.AAC.1